MSKLKHFYEVVNILRSSVQIGFGSEYFDLHEETYLERMPLWKKIGLTILHLNFWFSVTSMIISAYMARDDILLLLSLVMYDLIFLGAAYTALITGTTRSELIFPAFCYNQEFHAMRNTIVDRYCGDFDETVGSNSVFLAKLFRIVIIMGVFLVTVFGPLVAFFMGNGDDYPLPIPIIFFVLKPVNFITYFINYISISMAFVIGASFYCGIVSSGLVTAIYVLGRYDIVIELCANMKEILEEISFKEFSGILMKHMIISRSLNLDFSDATSGLFYFLQFQCYTTLFTSWFIINTNFQAIGQIFPGLIILGSIGIVVLFNEAFISKFEELAAAFYEAEWYTLPVNDQKAFIIFLSMAQNPTILTAGGINDLTLDWYSNIFKQAYNTALYIKDIL